MCSCVWITLGVQPLTYEKKAWYLGFLTGTMILFNLPIHSKTPFWTCLPMCNILCRNLFNKFLLVIITWLKSFLHQLATLKKVTVLWNPWRLWPSYLRKFITRHIQNIDIDQMISHASFQNPILFRTPKSIGLDWVYRVIFIWGVKVGINE